MTVSIGKVHSAGGAAAYFAADNYYTAEQSEAVSAWAGEGAKDLGLSGTVDTATFERILNGELRSEEHTSELQSLMRSSYAVFCLQKKKQVLQLTVTINYKTITLVCINIKIPQIS